MRDCAHAGRRCLAMVLESSAVAMDKIAAFVYENQGIVVGLCVALAAVAATQFAVSTGYLSRRKCVLTDAYKQFPLIAKTVVSHNTRLFRFALPADDVRLGLPLGHHLSIRAFIDGSETRRPYTPVSSDNDLGYFELLIKVYPAPHGKMSRYLDALQIGDAIDVRGPLGKFSYKPNSYRKLAMVCGGTGITPMWQVFREILADDQDSTQVSLVFANVSEEDILLRTELERLAATSSRFKVYFVLNEAKKDWKGGVGFVTAAMLMDRFGDPSPDTLVMICGPPPMNKAMKSHLASIGYSDKQIFKF